MPIRNPRVRSARLGAALVALLSGACAELPETQDASLARLPPIPRAEDLVPFYVSAASSNQFLLDAPSLDVEPDRDIQLTLVVRAPGGAETVTREAIRCQSAEYRILAIGRGDGSWSRVAAPDWRRIENNTLNRHRAALAGEYLCDGPASVIDAATVLRGIRNPRQMQPGIGTAP